MKRNLAAEAAFPLLGDLGHALDKFERLVGPGPKRPKPARTPDTWTTESEQFAGIKYEWDVEWWRPAPEEAVECRITGCTMLLDTGDVDIPLRNFAAGDIRLLEYDIADKIEEREAAADRDAKWEPRED